MKRVFCIFLSLAMLFCCVGVGYAAEPEEYVPSGSYGEPFDTFGPDDFWTYEQWQASWEWTDEQWDAYYEQYWMWYDAEGWMYFVLIEKEYLGMPYTDLYSVNVRLNGKFITFGDARPFIYNSLTMIPVRGLAENMGADVNFEPDTGAISAVWPDGSRMDMALHSNVMTYSPAAGDTVTVELAAEPLLIDGSTYVPLRAIAETLGLEVGWNSYFYFADLTDWRGFVAEADAQFTAINAILAASANAADLSKSYLSKDNLSLTATLYGENENDTASITLKGESISKGLAASGSYKLTVDVGQLEELINYFTGDPEMLEYLKLLSDGEYDVITDLENNTLYFKGSNFGELSENIIPSNIWIDFSPLLEELLGGTGSYISIVEPGATLGNIIMESVVNSYYGYEPSPYYSAYEEAREMLAIYSIVVGDGNFKTSASGSRVTYSAALDMDKLLNNAVAAGLITVEDVEYFKEYQSFTSLNVDINAVIDTDELISASIKGDVVIPGWSPSTISFAVSTDGLSSQASFSFVGRYVGRVDMSVTSSVSESASQPLSGPPAGDQVISIYELYEQYMPEPYGYYY